MSISKTMSEKEILTDKIENLETSTQITCNKVLKLKRLIFASSQDTYVDAVEAKKDINLLASYLRQNPYQQVVIEAHTSIVANEEKEHKITSKRLKRVKNDLIERGVAENQIITTAKGDSDLLIKKPINSKEHQKNRRVIAKISCY